MDIKDALSNALTDGVAAVPAFDSRGGLQAGTPKEGSLVAHDKVHHPKGYKKGDTCKFRDTLLDLLETTDQLDEGDAGEAARPAPQTQVAHENKEGTDDVVSENTIKDKVQSQTEYPKSDVAEEPAERPTPKWDGKTRAEAERAANALRNILGGVTVEFSDKPYSESGDDSRKSIGGVFTGSETDYEKPALHNMENGFGVYGYGYEGTTLRKIAERDPLNKKFKNLYKQTFFTNRAKGDESHILEVHGDVTDEQMRWVAEELNKSLATEAERWAAKGNNLVRTDKLGRLTFGPFKGGQLYSFLKGQVHKHHGNNFQDNERLTSELLARANIDGIKSPELIYGKTSDEDKRGWKYVSFRDDNIRVDHKWVDGVRRFSNPQGTTVGEYNRKTGKITLYPGAQVSDVVHEFSHGLWQFAEQEAAEGRTSLQTKMHDIAESAPQSVKDAVSQNYPDVTDSVYLEECFTHELARKSDSAFAQAIETDDGKAWYMRAWKAIKSIWKGLFDRITGDKADMSNLDSMPPEEAANHILSEMAKGRRFGSLDLPDSSASDDDTRQSIIGAKGAKNLGIKGLKDAKSMLSQGASRDSIYKKTGWWQGTDGKWRVEIPDLSIPKGIRKELKNELSSPNGVATGRLANFISEQIYPENTMSEEEADAAYEEAMRKGDMDKAQRILDLTSGLADPEETSEIIRAYPLLADTRVRLFRKKSEDGSWGAYDYYNNEITLYGVNPNNIKALESRLTHEVQHAIQKAEGLAKGGNMDDTGYDEHDNPTTFKNSRYWRSAGEVEARNAQSRFGTDKKKSPWKTEDVPADKQIVDMNKARAALANFDALMAKFDNKGDAPATDQAPEGDNSTMDINDTIARFDALLAKFGTEGKSAPVGDEAPAMDAIYHRYGATANRLLAREQEKRKERLDPRASPEDRKLAECASVLRDYQVALESMPLSDEEEKDLVSDLDNLCEEVEDRKAKELRENFKAAISSYHELADKTQHQLEKGEKMLEQQDVGDLEELFEELATRGKELDEAYKAIRMAHLDAADALCAQIEYETKGKDGKDGYTSPEPDRAQMMGLLDGETGGAYKRRMGRLTPRTLETIDERVAHAERRWQRIAALSPDEMEVVKKNWRKTFDNLLSRSAFATNVTVSVLERLLLSATEKRGRGRPKKDKTPNTYAAILGENENGARERFTQNQFTTPDNTLSKNDYERYGSLNTKAPTDSGRFIGSQYGDVVIRWKKSGVCATFFCGDSLCLLKDSLAESNCSLVSTPSPCSFSPEDKAFIYLLKERVLDIGVEDLMSLLRIPMVELQYHGGLDPAAIDSIAFPDKTNVSALSAKALETIKSLGVDCYIGLEPAGFTNEGMLLTQRELGAIAAMRKKLEEQMVKEQQEKQAAMQAQQAQMMQQLQMQMEGADNEKEGGKGGKTPPKEPLV